MPAQGRRLAPIQSTAPGRESPAPRCMDTEITSGWRGRTEAVTNARQHSGMAAPLRDAAGPPPAPPRGALPPAPPPGSPRRRRNTSPVAVDEAPLNDLAPAGPRRSPAGSPDRKLALVAEVSPVDDALGDVRVARAAKPGLALVPELEPTAEAWGDVAPGPARAPRGGRLSLVPEEPPEAPAPAPAPARRRSNCLLDCLRRRRREASP